MLNKILKIFLTVVGAVLGASVWWLCRDLYQYFSGTPAVLDHTMQFWIMLGGAIGVGLLFFFLSDRFVKAFQKAVRAILDHVSGLSPAKVFSGILGLILGLVVAALVSIIIGQIPVPLISVLLTIFDFLFFGYMGFTLGMSHRFDLAMILSKKSGKSGDGKAASPKILDTSVIIDGRILDICKTGIFEGEMIVPEFVLGELQRIADSGDSIKRTRGRRGLDILREMQKTPGIPVRIVDKDYDDIAEVDIKLLRMAKDMDGKVVTNDYNLNKVAQLQGVSVFNINELSNAVKPVLATGEELVVTIVKDGKEQGQGVAYLDDGTMIVVDGGSGMNDQMAQVVVTSVLQTVAGRMVFARLKTKVEV